MTLPEQQPGHCGHERDFGNLCAMAKNQNGTPCAWKTCTDDTRTRDATMQKGIPEELIRDIEICLRIGCDGTLPNEKELLRAVLDATRKNDAAKPKCNPCIPDDGSDCELCLEETGKSDATAPTDSDQIYYLVEDHELADIMAFGCVKDSPVSKTIATRKLNDFISAAIAEHEKKQDDELRKVIKVELLENESMKLIISEVIAEHDKRPRPPCEECVWQAQAAKARAEAILECRKIVGDKTIFDKCPFDGDCGRCFLCDNAGGCMIMSDASIREECNLRVDVAKEAARAELLDELDKLALHEAKTRSIKQGGLAFVGVQVWIDSLRGKP